MYVCLYVCLSARSNWSATARIFVNFLIMYFDTDLSTKSGFDYTELKQLAPFMNTSVHLY